MGWTILPLPEKNRRGLMGPLPVEIKECKHPDEKHTVWYWIDEDDPFTIIPYSLTFDNLVDAMQWITATLVEPNPRLHWMKAFRADNEVYTCWYWKNPDPAPEKPTPWLTERPRRLRWWQRRRWNG